MGWFGLLHLTKFIKNSSNIQLAVNVNKLLQFETIRSPSWLVTELFAGENRLDADSEITNKEVFPYLGFALTEEDK